MLLTSYHVHSRWSDGKADVADYIRAAAETNLNEIGISDHYVLTPDGRSEYFSMPLDAIDDYVEDVQNSAGEAPENLIVRLGLEVDYFPETESAIKDLLASYPFDYVIGSIHFVNGFPIDEAVEPWERLSQKERNDEIRGYWVRLRQMAESKLFDFAGHLDLTKKFDFYSTEDLTEEISAAIGAIANSNMAFEVNTSGWFKPCEEVYPAQSIIQECYDKHIPVLVTSDSHVPENLIRGYDEGFRLIKDIGYTQIASYAGRMRAFQDI